jgi:hypothetical protein
MIFMTIRFRWGVTKPPSLLEDEEVVVDVPDDDLAPAGEISPTEEELT